MPSKHKLFEKDEVMKTFSALIDIGDFEGRYTKIEHQSGSVENALAELEAQHGIGNVYSVEEPTESLEPQGV